MATYSKKKLLSAHPNQIPQIAEAIRYEFEMDGFEVYIDNLMSGGKDISITKGGLFKAILGMRSALKISLSPQTDGVMFHANIGIFGQQAIPTVIMLFYFWPVLITQIWGLVKQSSLDDRALAIAIRAGHEETPNMVVKKCSNPLCSQFGIVLNKEAIFCPECGKKLK